MPSVQKHALGFFLLVFLLFPIRAFCQEVLRWEQVRERFMGNNPTLYAGRLFVREAEANEITASLRPNPTLASVNDQLLFFNSDRFKPFETSQWTQTISQLFERRNKRGLRVESARVATAVATADVADQERQLLFGLRDAFDRTLQAKAVLELAAQNLEHYDRVLGVNRDRFQAGDIARVDLARLELQRAQFESDVVNAQVNLRTAKIALLALMNERQPVDSFDIRGDFGFQELRRTLEEARRATMESRPDLQSAMASIRKAEADNRLAWANGSTDPIMELEYQRTQRDNTMGFGISIPLRIFDRNQGEKARTALEIDRAKRVRDAVVAGIYRDVDSAYAAVSSVLDLLRPYRDRYLPRSAEVRDTLSFSYNNGGATLLELLDAEKSYRDTQLAYRSLIGSYRAAVNQLNLAVGREVIP